MNKKILIAFLMGLLLTVICTMLIGEGHGSVKPSVIVFPLAIVIAMVLQSEVIFYALALIQFPLYVFIINKARRKRWALTILVVVHAALIAGAWYYFFVMRDSYR